MSSTKTPSFKREQGNDRKTRQKMRALNAELGAVKLELAQTRASAEKVTRALNAELEAAKLELAQTRASAEKVTDDLKFEIAVLNHRLDSEIGRADAEASWRKDLFVRAKSSALDVERVNKKLEDANERITSERQCMEFLRNPNEAKPLYNYVMMRIFDTYKDFPPAQKLCILCFWELLYNLDETKVVELSRGELHIYSVFKCSLITVKNGPEWRKAMVNLVSTHPAFQCDGAGWFKYDPANPTMCVFHMLMSARFNELGNPLETTEGVPPDDPICLDYFSYRWGK